MKKTLVILPILFSATAFGQRSSDLTLHLSTYDDSKIAIEYRVPIKDKWCINFALAYGSNSNSYDTFLDANDSVYTYHYSTTSSANSTFRLGTDRRIKESMFSVGFDFLLAYRKQEIHRDRNEYTIDSLGNWRGYLGYSGLNHINKTKHYIVPGIQLNVKMDIPIKKNFELNLSAGYTVSSPFLFNETNIIDPDNELSHSKLLFINTGTYASIGLRYKFLKNT
jgi:hypothetical protein